MLGNADAGIPKPAKMLYSMAAPFGAARP